MGNVSILISDIDNVLLYLCGDIDQGKLHSLIQCIARMELQNIGMFHRYETLLLEFDFLPHSQHFSNYWK